MNEKEARYAYLDNYQGLCLEFMQAVNNFMAPDPNVNELIFDQSDVDAAFGAFKDAIESQKPLGQDALKKVNVLGRADTFLKVCQRPFNDVESRLDELRLKIQGYQWKPLSSVSGLSNDEKADLVSAFVSYQLMRAWLDHKDDLAVSLADWGGERAPDAQSVVDLISKTFDGHIDFLYDIQRLCAEQAMKGEEIDAYSELAAIHEELDKAMMPQSWFQRMWRSFFSSSEPNHPSL